MRRSPGDGTRGRTATVLGASVLMLATMATGTAAAQPGVDLRSGAVYTMSNARGGNEVAVFDRAPDGRLTRVATVPTGGSGSGSFEDSSNGVVLGSSRGEEAPNNLTGDNELLFVTNAGSDTVSVFRVERDRLVLADVED